MNPLYNMLMGQQAVRPQAPYQVYGQTFQNPLQKANYILQALKNPAAFDTVDTGFFLPFEKIQNCVILYLTG